MNEALPRPLIYAGVPLLLGAFGVALWAWSHWGVGIFFDMASDGVPFCQ